MSLIRQMALLLVAVVLLALLGSVSANLLAARATLATQLSVKNADNATALALALSQHRGDATAMALLMAAQFDTGHYRRIRLLPPQGGAPSFVRESEVQRSQAPAWFEALLPIDAPPGQAQVSDGWRALGTLELESQSAYAYNALWSGALHAAGLLLAVGLAAGGVAAWGVGALRRPLTAMVEQAQALQDGRFVSVDVPRTPELKALAGAMNGMVQRLRSVFESQAQQVEALRQQAERDALTGVSNRRLFVARLGAALGGERGHAGGALVMVRVLALEQLNRRAGREAADLVLRAVAQSLLAYEQRVEGGFAGRLNGADFALYLPAAGVAPDTAQALLQGLRAVLGALDTHAGICVGSAELGALQEAGQALAAVDDALAQAEAEGPFQWAHRTDASASAQPRSEAEWRRAIQEALGPGRSALAHYPVVSRQGPVLHLECPLRLRLAPDAAPEPASQWLSHALRSRLGPALDLRALDLALAELASDPTPRSVNLALDSLATAGFVADVRARLEAVPPLVRQRLWLELPERALQEHAALVQDAARQWGELGAQVGVEHAGGASAALGRLYELGLRFVKIDRRHVDGVASDADVLQFASSLVTLLRGMGLMVIAEGVARPEDLAALWELGFDGATGPAVSLPG